MIARNGSWQTMTLRQAIPNGLSLVRLALGLCFPCLAPAWRLPIIALAGLTDLFDGFSARLLRSTSDLGRFLDPLADKVFLLAVVITLLLDRVVTPVEVMLVGARDLVVFAGLGGGLVLGRLPAMRQLSPTLLGKVATAAQFVFLLVLLLVPHGKEIVLAPTACSSVLAAGHYIWLFLTPHGVHSRSSS